jgi:hypothetical protein
VLIGAAVIAGPVMAAVAAIVNAVIIIVIVLLGVGAAGLVAVVAYRLGRRRQETRPG